MKHHFAQLNQPLSIIATLGPNSFDSASARTFYDCGAQIMRLNFAHQRDNNFALIKEIKLRSPEIQILVDLPGPKMRIGRCKPLTVQIDDEFIFYPEKKLGLSNEPSDISKQIPISNLDSVEQLTSESEVSLRDATIKIAIQEIIQESEQIICRAKNSITLQTGLGVNISSLLEGSEGSADLCDEDKIVLDMCKELDIDIISASFVKNEYYIKLIKKYLNNYKNSRNNLSIWAKIETQKSLENLYNILEESDGIIIGRGDLGAEVGLEYVPYYQDKILKIVRELNEKIFDMDNINQNIIDLKSVVIATDFLKSMMSEPKPSRAEIQDIYSAIKGGCSGIILTSETAYGKYAVEAIHQLKKMDDLYWSMNIDL
jgi:pyruvate kinase